MICSESTPSTNRPGTLCSKRQRGGPYAEWSAEAEGGQFERSGFRHTQDRPLHSLDGFELQAGTPHWLNGAHHASHAHAFCASYAVVSCCSHWLHRIRDDAVRAPGTRSRCQEESKIIGRVQRRGLRVERVQASYRCKLSVRPATAHTGSAAADSMQTVTEGAHCENGATTR